ncbi:hypothetical protein [Schlesneria paludicola]|uniref:hypothetical protein n=1 Tax=Schlesneria paludicola TaxID=360056 RepID=UPI00029A2422|nr:hypothetical protein [Schlesneria paludicola]
MTYFTPLRRKIGVVTTLMACVFTAGWVRSLLIYDLALLALGDVTFCIETGWGEIDFGRVTTPGNKSHSYWKSALLDAKNWRYQDEHGNPRLCDHLSEDVDEVEWRWDWAGFHFGAGRDANSQTEDYILPFWSIVAPLSVLSAWLLFSEPRHSVSA